MSNTVNTVRCDDSTDFLISRANVKGSRTFDGWYKLASLYSYCSITKTTDRLPALSGIVSTIAGFTHEQYYAGVWEHAILEGLSWSLTHKRLDGSSLRNAEYIAPTWSWLAFGSQVMFAFRSGRIKSHCATVENIAVECKGHNKYGEIVAGSLELNASTPLMKIDDSRKYVVGRLNADIDGHLELFRVRLSLDYKNLPADWTIEIAVLYCYCATEKDGVLFYINALVLRRLENDTYHRIGHLDSYISTALDPTKRLEETIKEEGGFSTGYLENVEFMVKYMENLPKKRFTII